MANEEVLGPRKTMFVLVIVVGCFAVLWPRILSPLMLGQAQLKPNQFDRDAGCCEVIFEPEMAVLELVNEVCSSAVGSDGKLSIYAAAECRKTVNETCGLDIAAFLKRSDNVGKSTKVLLNTMKQSNSSCLKEHFGVPVWSLGAHTALNSWAMQDDSVKQERSPTRGAGPHPALRERGRAIPAGAPTPPSRGPVLMPPHARVRSPLSVYFDGDIKPPPIPGMRPPLGSPGGPVPAPKSSMGFVMPIYTICIIVFFVYTLSKILFKRTGSVPYEHVAPDPQFRRRVFRDDSRSTPDSKLGPKERDARDVELEALRARLEETERAMQRIVGQLAKRDAVGPVLWTPFGTSRSTLSDIVVTAISGLVAEVHQQMEANYAQSQQRQDSQENHTRPYTNGSVHSSPIIIASEYETKEKTPEPEKAKEASPEPELTQEKQPASEPETHKEAYPEPKEPSPEIEPTPEPEKLKEASPEPKQPSPEKESTSEPETRKESSPETKEPSPEIEPIPESEKHKKASPEPKQPSPEKQPILEPKEQTPELEREATPKPSPEKELSLKPSPEESEESLDYEREPNHIEEELLKLTEDIKEKKENLAKSTEEFLNDAREKSEETEELLREALKEESPVKEVTEEEDEEGSEPDNVSVKVVGMELTASGAPAVAAAPAVASAPARSLHDESKQHEAEEVTSIFLDTHIPQQSRVLVADFEDRAKPRRHEPTVVSGKMTLSLIQDEPRDTPERDPESTVDDFTTASAMTQPVAEKEGQSSDEEVEEEIEIEEIEEEVEDEEEEESRKTQN